MAARRRRVLPDVLAPGLRLVFCGSAPGLTSAKVGAYYAGPGNKFWPTLFEVGLTNRRLKPQEYRTLLAHGIGLTDLAKFESGSDRQLSGDAYDPDRLRKKIEKLQPAILAFVGKAPAKAFFGTRHVDRGWQSVCIGKTKIFILPSPSGAAQGHWNKSVWKTLADASRKIGV